MLIKKIQVLLNNRRGDFGIKQIAITVAVILIIGAGVTMVKGTFLNTWITQVWNMLIKFIETNISYIESNKILALCFFNL